jgi:hypothetical protein
MQTTERGRQLLHDLYRAGHEGTWQQSHNTAYTLSLISRHAKTYRRLAEIQCGDGIHSGEWVNAHAEWLEKREAQVERRLRALGDVLPDGVTLELQGDPRGYLVRLIVTDANGIPRTVGVD